MQMDPITFARIALLSAILALSSPAVNSPAVSPTSPAGYTVYVVQSGDTLSSIARQFNTTMDTLKQVNHIDDPNSLALGQKIEVPTTTATTATPAAGSTAAATPTAAASALTYTVQSGDTLAAIAARYGLSVDDLAKTNKIQDVNSIAAGQVLVIPGKSSTLPDGIVLVPPVVKQGNTVEFKITASNAVTATGSFAGANLQFIQENGVLFALAGISRCARLTTYPASINVTTADGQTTPLNFSVRVNATNYPVQDITLTPGMAALLDPVIELADQTRIETAVSPLTASGFWSGPFRSPLNVKDPPISALFGTRRSYNGGAVGLCGHEGQDFAVDGGTPVYAPASGVVVLAETEKVRGNVVFINHGLGVYSGFYHLSEIDAKNGQRVNPGDLIGKVGTTGFSTGDHLHWSLWVQKGVQDPVAALQQYPGVYVDPIEWENRTIP